MDDLTSDIIPGTPTPVRLDIDINSRPNTGSASGDSLWRLGVYGATRPDGKGPQIGLQRQVLTRDQSSRYLNGGDTLSFDGVDLSFDLSEIGCNTEYQYLCVEFAKGLRAQPDFKFETASGSDVVVKCKDEECRKGL